MPIHKHADSVITLSQNTFDYICPIVISRGIAAIKESLYSIKSESLSRELNRKKEN